MHCDRGKNAADVLVRGLRTLAAGRAAEGQPDHLLLERFVRLKDEAAFAALLERHGPMVLGVCRRSLNDEHLAEDVFQASFLLLARQAWAVRKRSSLGSWLHGVALRLARKARAGAARAARGDVRPRPEPPPGPLAEASWREVRQALDEELQRLPECYRLPLVLCYLEGHTRDEAAAQLGCAPGRLKGLLERGRERLRGRLIRRGLAPATAGVALLAETALAAPVPPLLAVGTLRAGQRLAAGGALRACGASATVIGMVDGGMGIMGHRKVLLVLALALAFGALGTGAGLLAQRADGPAAPLAREAPRVGRKLPPEQPGGGVAGVKLDATAAADKPEVMLGEPTYVSFKVANRTGRDLRVMVGGDYRNRLGRPESFKVEVVGAGDKKVPQPNAGPGMGGITSAQKLPARGAYTFRLFLPDWATFERPGRYTLTIRRRLEIVPDDGADPFRRKAEAIDVSAIATITVVPTDPAKMGKVIARLGDRMLDRKNSDRAEQAQKMLAATNDVRVVPYFVALASMPHFSPRLAACGPLGRYQTDEALEALKKLARTTGAEIRASATTLELAETSADGVRHGAAHALAGSPHPKAVPFLWTMADDRYYGVRLTVLHKAAELKTPEALGILLKMSCDPNETVRNEAIRYLKKRARGGAQ
jgi:RNA polymerase sigma factor (sigma-70 family)